MKSPLLSSLAALILAASLHPQRVAPTSSAEFFVSTDGSDANIGSRTRPFATLARAREAVRDLRRTQNDPRRGLTVWISGGTYSLEESLELGPEDSNISWAALDKGNVRFINSRRVDPGSFKRVSDPKTLSRIPEKLRGRILELDLVGSGIQHRKPYQNVFTGTGGIVELYLNRQRQPLSRFPNNTQAGDQYMTMRRVLNTGGGLQDRNWNSPANVAVPPPDNGGTFEYRDEFSGRHSVWQSQLERGVWMKGYWRVAWQSEAVRIKAIDTDKHTVTLARPVPGGIGSKYHRPEGSGEEKYWLLNLLEEVDSPGEWCLDFKDQKIYFYPPAELAGAEIYIADQESPVIKISGGSNIALKGLTIEGSLGDGVLIENGTDNLIAGCTVRNVSRNAIVVRGGSRNTVQSCDLFDLGAGGVWLSGGDEKSQPRIAAGHRVINNHIHHFAQIDNVYAAGINAGFTGGGGGGHHTAVGMYVAHNLIHDTPHVGVLFGSWDSVFEYNEIFRYCQVSNDMGGFYSYDLYDRMGNQTFRYNFLHSTDDGDGIYFDHDHRDMHIYGNVVFLRSTGKRGMAFLYKSGSQARNPQGIECYNNIAIRSKVGFTFVTGPGSKIENNFTVECATPFSYSEVKAGKETRSTDILASGRNIAYPVDPGFSDLAKFDLRLRPDSRVFKDLPGFKPIPFEKIGLYVDEYRKRLPTNEEIDRFSLKARKSAAAYEVLDRK